MGETSLNALPCANVVHTRLARAAPESLRFLVDFEGAVFRELGEDTAIDVSVVVEGGQVIERHTEHNPRAARCRAAFEVTRDSDAEVNLRAFLHIGSKVLTETWSYLCPRND